MRRVLVAFLVGIFGLTISARGAEPRAEVQAITELTTETLQATLVRLGFEPSRTKEDNLMFECDSMYVNCYVVDGATGTVKFFAGLAEVPKETGHIGAGLRRLLEANARIFPAYFRIHEECRHVQLHKYCKSTAWTPAALRREIESFAETARSTRSLWADGALQMLDQAEDPAAAAELRRFDGEYVLAPGSVREGTPYPDEQCQNVRIRITDGHLSCGGKSLRLHVTPTTVPGAIDAYSPTLRTSFGWYRFEQGKLILHFGGPTHSKRPDKTGKLAEEDSLLICVRKN